MGDGYYVVKSTPTRHRMSLPKALPRPPCKTTDTSPEKSASPPPIFPVYFGGIVVERTVDLKGNTVYVDSYDSTDPLFSTSGVYDPDKRRDNGHIASNFGMTNSVSVGNANIFGKVDTAPGGSVYTGPLGAVGSLAWQTAGNTGVQPGWVSSDFNMLLEPVPGPAPGAGLVPNRRKHHRRRHYDYILTDGLWRLDSLEGKIYVAGNATLVVSGSSTFGDNTDAIIIAKGASLKMWGYGETPNMSSDVIDNLAKNPDAFHYYGGPNNKSLSIAGAVKFEGLINAPTADVTPGRRW